MMEIIIILIVGMVFGCRRVKTHQIAHFKYVQLSALTSTKLLQRKNGTELKPMVEDFMVRCKH